MIRILVCAALAAAALTVGCGDSDDGVSESREVERVAQAYVEAVNDGDAGAACEFERVPADVQCVDAMQEEMRNRQLLGTGFGDVKKVCLNGDVAYAYFSNGGFLALGKTVDGWKIGAPADEDPGDCPT